MKTTNVSKYAGNVIHVYISGSVKERSMTIKIQHLSDAAGWGWARARSQHI